MAPSPTVHASAVLVGARAVLIRGPSGAGKSRLTLALIEAARGGLLPFARLVADDRVELEACHGRLVVRAPKALAGLVEVRSLGIRRVPYEQVALVGLVVDLSAAVAQRSPSSVSQSVTVGGVLIHRLAVAAGADPLPLVLAFFGTAASAI
jgi:HPr kinase/phosphorylase